MPQSRRLAGTVLAAMVLVAPFSAFAATDVADAWSALWSNRSAEAEQLFRQVLDEDDDQAAAWRGLLLTHLLLGRDEFLADDLDEYARRSEGEPCDWSIAAFTDELTGRDSRKHYRALYEAVKRLADRDELPVVDRRILLDQRVNYAFMRGEPDECRKLARELGRIERWAILGPFDNTSGAGHPRDHIDGWEVRGGHYPGKHGQQIEWMTPRLVGRDGIVVVSHYFAESEETTAYLRTVVEIDDTDRYLLSISHAGDVEVMVDGEILFRGSRKTDGQEAAHFELTLTEGPHLLAAKLSNRDESSQFGVGISELDGDRADLEIRPEWGFQLPAETNLDARSVIPSYRRALAADGERALTADGDPEGVFWLLAQSTTTATPDSVRRLCRRVEEAFPETAALWVMCGVAYQRLEDSDDARRVMAHAGELDPSLVLPRLHEAREDLRKRRHDAVIATCDAILATAPRCHWALDLRLQSLLGRQDLERVERLARDLTETLDDQPLGWDHLARWAEARGMRDEGRRYQREALRRRPPLARHYQRLVEQMGKEDYREVEDALDELLEYTPDMPWLWSSLVESQVATEKYGDAIETLDVALRSFPQDVQLLYWKALFAEGEAYWDRGHPDGERYAARLIEQALNFAPGSLPLRDKHRTLSGLTPYREYLPDPDLADILDRRVDAGRYPGARAVVLQEWKRRLFFADDISMLDYALAVQVLTKAGVEAWESYGLGAGAAGRVLVDRKTIKADGAEVEATVFGNDVHFENLEPGDVVVLRYQSTQFQGGQLRGHAWDQHRFPFGDPCLESRYELISRANLDVAADLHNQDAFGSEVAMETEDLDDGFKLRRWVLRDVPALSYEAHATHYRSYLPWLDVSTVPAWRTIATWYADIADGQAEATRVVRDKARALCQGAATDDEKIERIYRFVSQDISYASVPFYMSAHVPRKAEEVLESRYGDCKDKSCLMIAMLAAVGIDDARFALIDSWGARAVAMLPSPRFNHAIVCRPDGAGGYRWYDPTIKYGTSRQIPGSLIGGLALIADADAEDLVTIAGEPAVAHPSRVTSEVVVRADGSASVRRRSEDTDLDGTAGLRAGLENLTPDELREGVLESIAVNFPGAVLDTLAVSGRADVDSALVYAYEFDAPQLFRESGAFLVGRVPWASRLSGELSRVVARAERQSPVDLHRLRACEVETLTVVLPADVTVMELPAAQDLRFGDCRYTTSYEQDGDRLLVSSEIVFDGDRVLPDDYAGFKSFLEAVLQDQDAPLLLRRQG